MTNADTIKTLAARVDELEKVVEPLKSVVVLSTWQIRVVTWTSNAVIGILTISGLYIVGANLLKAIDSMKGFLK